MAANAIHPASLDDKMSPNALNQNRDAPVFSSADFTSGLGSVLTDRAKLIRSQSTKSYSKHSRRDSKVSHHSSSINDEFNELTFEGKGGPLTTQDATDDFTFGRVPDVTQESPDEDSRGGLTCWQKLRFFMKQSCKDIARHKC